MEKIISILKKLNKKTSNWTSRIKTADDYFNFQEKISSDEKYFETVFILEFDDLKPEIKRGLLNTMIKVYIKNSSYIILFNKNNFYYFDLNEINDINILNIKKFLNFSTEIEACVVCLEKNDYLLPCTKCSCNICKGCEQKLDNCPICKRPLLILRKCN